MSTTIKPTGKQFVALLKRTVEAQWKANQLKTKLGEMCVERYGVHWSDVDCDAIIDAIEHGAGQESSIEDIDRYMKISLGDDE